MNNNKMQDLIDLQLTRRKFVKYSSMFGALMCLPKLPAFAQNTTTGLANSVSHTPLQSIPVSTSDNVSVANELQTQNVISWGDKLVDNLPSFDPLNQRAEDQLQRFGYNNDFIAFMPLPRGSQSSDHGLLCVNHEYPTGKLMFPEGMDEKLVSEVEMAAVGHSVVEVKKQDGQWNVVSDSKYNRRISLFDTKCELTGPARGSDRLRTSKDSRGKVVVGTMGNCAGGKTPWNTVLSAEENINYYFSGALPFGSPEVDNHDRMGIKVNSKLAWSKYDDRFDLSVDPNEPNRFGWVLEYDPYDSQKTPKKRTALGRFKHEGATTTLAQNNRVVVYMGDDERFQHLYKFVSDKPTRSTVSFDDDILDSGTLYVARFYEDLSMQWLPLVYGQGELNEKNGFASQADVLIETRRAAELVGATKMDRPEDVQTNPVNGHVYVCLTNNTKRINGNAPNPRPLNLHGHIIEIIPGGNDHGNEAGVWDIFMLAGVSDTKQIDTEDQHGAILSCPDNVAFDHHGNIWVATDGMGKTLNVNDGVYMMPTEGEKKAYPTRVFNAPRGAEVCGPEFTPDGKTLFVAVQHPGEGSSFSKPSTRWPDFDASMPPRPTIVAITRKNGEELV